MKLTIKSFLLLLLVLALSCSNKEIVEKDDDPPTTDSIKIHAMPEYKTETISINAPSLINNLLNVKTIQNARVLLPPFYSTDSNKHYPVVYFIHGYSGNYLNDYGIFD